ncbi:uncharacterized protein BO88DRAFT_406785 [Aspergillus vadensis CBS 113365]|uniref:Uncharacterized protein n=1 Tax=Aspergillus vadensis (strain CBS 113365 / IMI 142717 / IBT 24658) TaxID=1448311 RepID=A0A319B0Z8_ASPVC|nr:hypothetical protein BO88DRAFT_406785 [Aspergillus vadensis CBS 113365]PYH66316.1 hypothetical protein BO88DRAFT_406785 [Aspergillus vadensis CBS 113365]
MPHTWSRPRHRLSESAPVPNLVVSWPGTPEADPRSQLESNIGASTPNGYGSIAVEPEDHVKAMAVNCPKETGGGNPCTDSSKSHGGRLDVQWLPPTWNGDGRQLVFYSSGLIDVWKLRIQGYLILGK